MLRLTTLGSLELTDDHGPALAGRRKVLAMLAWLARRAGRPVQRAALADLFWPAVDEVKSRQSLRTALTELRGAVGEALDAAGDLVRVDGAAIEVDATAFERAVDRSDLDGALDLWRGDFLTGLEDLGGADWRAWLESERASLRKRLGWALATVVVKAEAEGRLDRAIAVAEQWTRDFPAEETAATRLVTLLRAAGRTGEAGARHAGLRRRLEETTGRPPSSAFTDLAPRGAPTPATPGVRGLLTPDLVGRAEALAGLELAWRTVAGGPGRTVVIEGDPGLGKTRLLEVFARTVAGQASVLMGRAFEAELDRPLSTVRPLLDQLATAPGLAAAPPLALATLASHSPSIRERFPAPATGSIPIEDALARAVTDVAFEARLVVLVDDAPLADPESRRALAGLARRPPPGLLMVLTGTAAAWATSPEIADLPALESVAHIVLAPLTVDDTARLISSVATMEPALVRTLAQRLHHETGGQPATIRLLVAELVDRKLLHPDSSGRWTLTVPTDQLVIPIPEETATRVRSLIVGLGSESRRVLEAAAVIGPRIDAGLLEQVASLEAESFRMATADLLARRLLRGRAEPEIGFEFPGEAERRAVIAGTPPSARRAFHRAAARALRNHRDPDHRRQAAEHLRQGGSDSRRGLIVAAVAAVVILVAVFVRQVRSAAAVPSGTPVLLASVENLTGDSTLAGALDLAARVGLQQTGGVVLVPPGRIAGALGRMGRTIGPGGLTEPLAREIATRENVTAVIHVAIAAVDTSYLLTGRIVEPELGRDLFTAKVTAAGRAGILGGLDRLISELRGALGDRPVAPVDDRHALPTVTTSSLEALRLYTQGLYEWNGARPQSAYRLWLRAVELDSGFAMALSSIADFHAFIGERGIDMAATNRYLALAMAHADRLTERERLVLLAKRARAHGNQEEALAQTRDLATRFPDRDTWYNYGTTLLRLDRWREAIEPLHRAIGYAPRDYFSWINLATSYRMGGLLDSAIHAYGQAELSDSNAIRVGGNVNQEWGDAWIRIGKPEVAESLFRRATSLGDRNDQSFGVRALGWLEAFQGRYGRAAELFEEAAVSAEELKLQLSSARSRWLLGWVHHLRGDDRTAARELDRARRDLGDLVTAPSFLFHLACANLAAGRVAEARAVQALFEKGIRAGDREDQGQASLLRGMLALAAGQIDSAIAESRRYPPEITSFAGLRDQLLAMSYQRLGQLDSALAAATRAEHGWHFGYEAQFPWRHAPLGVTKLALQLGDTARAAAALARLLAAWKDADEGFPDLVEARRLDATLARRR